MARITLNPATWLPGWMKSLSAKLILLSIVFVMLGEILIYVPSIARFRAVYLQDKVDAARLATFALAADPLAVPSDATQGGIVEQAGVVGVRRTLADGREIALSDGMEHNVYQIFDLSQATPASLIFDALRTMMLDEGGYDGERYIQVTGGFADPGASQRLQHADEVVSITLAITPLREAMIEYSARILYLSVVMSLIVAALLFISLHLLMVRPIREITSSMVRFRNAPEDMRNVIEPSSRTDEIGTAEHELADMQDELRHALRQRSRLASLGSAVSKINHDLRNTLASAQLISDRLTEIKDPTVAEWAPRLISSIGRAIDICTTTLRYSNPEDIAPQPVQFRLAPLVADVGDAVALMAPRGVEWIYAGPEELGIHADPDQMYRVLLNLGRNAAQAIEASGSAGGAIKVSAHEEEGSVIIEISDTGPGIPERVRETLFQPFQSGSKRGGTGLGLVTSQDLVHAVGGEISLTSTGEQGTTFRIELPKD